MPDIWKNVSVVFTAALVGSLITGAMISQPTRLQSDAIAQDRGGNLTTHQAANLDTAQDLSSAFRNVADMLRPSVVSISTKQTRIIRRAGRGLPRGFRTPPGFEDFFNQQQGPEERQERSVGSGSGVIVRQDGYILTNNHVIQGADALEVEFSDGSSAPGKIVGTDPDTDLAVVKVDLPNLKAVKFGDSDKIRVGDWVLAIGSPFGLDQTVTAGIISGKNRDQDIIGEDGEGFEDFLQTDAAINPGNSGGALVNLRGELVGINTAILSRSGASAGIGFAIPVGLARPVLSSIIETGTVRRGFLGAGVRDLTPSIVKEFNLPVTAGALIGNVLEGKPAANAGLKPGDIVTRMDSRIVTSGSQLRNYIAGRLPGAVVVMDINRDGKPMQVKVNLQERTDSVMAAFKAGEVMGAELIPANEETAREYGYSDLKSGLIVTNVKDGTDAENAGLKPGDIIESAAGAPLKSVADFEKILDAGTQRQQNIRVIVRRANERMLMVVRP
ncbi:Do family serine endopeptidase [Planctomycetes bacterium K23_9]|uniref:Periplasmic serine endoprotease DegP n=1 Tax=Stieleria marina TaxID=1930275 RepID=A0A517P3H0_9BACT|nr:Periplasmic serine endoprotease DegP precursor [Planctomycetes bacterium K23_9]